MCSWWFHNKTVGSGTPRIPSCHSGQAHSLFFCPSRALSAVCWLGCHRPPGIGYPPVLGLLCLWPVVTAAGLVPLTIVVLLVSFGGAGGLYSVGGVVLLVDFVRVTSERGVLSQCCTTPAFGQGSFAALMVCLIPRPQCDCG